MVASSVRFKWNKPVLDSVKLSFTRGMVRMGYAVARQARANAPVKTGALRNSIRTTVDGNDNVYVVAGGTNGIYRVPYALRREYENNLHPGTKMYMHRAFDTVRRGDISQYFRSNAL